MLVVEAAVQPTLDGLEGLGVTVEAGLLLRVGVQTQQEPPFLLSVVRVSSVVGGRRGAVELCGGAVDWRVAS